ncbi:MAG: hypothetical protein B6245_23180 [Desulfobacteraceae bacterium 4572_88]|nr:MAG: hypothetical protein B6245_23180 [Desulfobacteraceae bacterium 4572_88]
MWEQPEPVRFVSEDSHRPEDDICPEQKIPHTENKMIFVTEFGKSPFQKNSMIFSFRATGFLI